ncbi:unnamed protein product [marine sediment metagenome]|uniref:Uncharacterized protein n=1 Tax=marine sediment metagenome TaxID=412755 RepID=X1TAR8_9ZZZZ
MRSKKAKTKSVGISPETFDRLTKLKAPKQVYDGFITQLLDLWEEKHGEKQPGPVLKDVH